MTRQRDPKVNVTGTDKITVDITPIDPSVSDTAIEEAKQDVIIATQLFEEKARKATWYFAWREGEEIVPEKVKTQEKSFNRLFIERSCFSLLCFIVLGMGLFIVVSMFYPSWFWVAPLVLIIVQFFLFFTPTKLLAEQATGQ